MGDRITQTYQIAQRNYRLVFRILIFRHLSGRLEGKILQAELRKELWEFLIISPELSKDR